MERSRRDVGGLRRPDKVKLGKHGLILLSMGDKGKGGKAKTKAKIEFKNLGG